jgi:phage FluMu protein Com
MKWLECIKSINLTGKSGKCPHCGSSQTDYRYVLLDKASTIGYLDVWCNNCKTMGHVSRVNVDENSENVISVDEVKGVIPDYKVTY